MAEIFCELCGAEIQNGSLACPVCGTPAPKGAGAVDTQPGPSGIEQKQPEYIDIAEVTVPGIQENISSAPAPEAPETPGTLPPEVSPFDEEYHEIISSVADASVLPGVVIPPEPVELTDTHTGGFKEGMAGPSVAGAGSQTADDPFGLNVSENPPIPMVITEEEGRLNRETLINIIIMVAAMIFVAGVSVLGVYLLVIKKPPPKTNSPETTVSLALNKVFSGTLAGIEEYAVPDSPFIIKADQIFEPYREIGTMTLKTFETETNVEGDKATLTIITLNIDIVSPEVNEVIDALTITKPTILPTIVHLEKRNNKWIITD
ncbi:MAG: zinc ribbon domain-containing protein [Actinobacteria bacterium]|nr:zinc ribbon domain-containing protein [Actinomycetota bacterium]